MSEYLPKSLLDQYHERLYEGAPTPLDPRRIETLFKIDNLKLTLPIVPKMGHMTHCEIGLLVGIVKSLRIRHFFEIGTFDGSTVLNLLENCSDLESVATVDLPPVVHEELGRGTKFKIDKPNQSLLGKVEIGSLFKGHVRSRIVKQILKDSALLKETDFDPKPDCCFIDGCHTYEYCRSDTFLCIELMQRPGVILIHDYGKIRSLPGVTRFIMELCTESKFPVFRLHSGDSETSLVVAFIE